MKNENRSYNKGTSKETPGLNDINLSIYEKELVALMGPSGTGKSTFLNILGGIDSPTSGKIFIDGTDIALLRGKDLSQFRRDNIGFIFCKVSS